LEAATLIVKRFSFQKKLLKGLEIILAVTSIGVLRRYEHHVRIATLAVPFDFAYQLYNINVLFCCIMLFDRATCWSATIA